MREEHPGLDENVVARHEPLTERENLLRPFVAAVAAVCCRVEDRGVDEERQPAASTASPT
jgi:hypothetical protein